MNKGIIRDTVILFIITLIAGICLGGVHEITAEPIRQAKIAAATATYQEVFPEAASFEDVADAEERIANAAADISAQSFGNVSVNDVKIAKDASGNDIGYLVMATSKDGYKGDIQVAVGVDNDSNITNIGFLSIDETPGLGMKAKDPEFKGQFSGKAAGKLNVVKTNPTKDDQILAISGATYSSNATTGAVNAAVYFAENCMK